MKSSHLLSLCTSICLGVAATVCEAVHLDPDFGQGILSTLQVQDTLGPNGLPVFESSDVVVHDIAPTGEITWWSPSLNLNVRAIGSTEFFNGFNATMFPPGPNLGSCNGFACGFLTAHFTGTLGNFEDTVLRLELGSDDDAFFYLDGTLRAELGGVHPFTTLSTEFLLPAGTHTFDLFYADREATEAALSFGLFGFSDSDTFLAPLTSAGGQLFLVVPEPSSFGLLSLASVLLLWHLFRHRSRA